MGEEHNNTRENINITHNDDISSKTVDKKNLLTVIMIVLAILLGVTVIAIIIFSSVLFFSSSDDLEQPLSTVQPSVTVESTEPTQEPTEKPTQAEKTTETKASKKEPTEVKYSGFQPYLITLYPTTYIHAGPSYDYQCVMTLDEQGVYTIVDEYYDMSTGLVWGKLKSGVGWINLKANVKKPVETQLPSFQPYVVTTYPPTYIYEGPGYNYKCVMTLDEQGAYTIVEEYYNSSTQSVWGKLKSGVGWIDLGKTG